MLFINLQNPYHRQNFPLYLIQALGGMQRKHYPPKKKAIFSGRRSPTFSTSIVWETVSIKSITQVNLSWTSLLW